jgi:hypothetical protein
MGIHTKNIQSEGNDMKKINFFANLVKNFVVRNKLFSLLMLLYFAFMTCAFIFDFSKIVATIVFIIYVILALIWGINEIYKIDNTPDKKETETEDKKTNEFARFTFTNEMIRKYFTHGYIEVEGNKTIKLDSITSFEIIMTDFIDLENNYSCLVELIINKDIYLTTFNCLFKKNVSITEMFSVISNRINEMFKYFKIA